MSTKAHAQPVPQASHLDPQQCSPPLSQRRAAFLPTLYPVERQVIAEATKADVLATSAPYVPAASIEYQAAQCLSAVTRMVPESVRLGWTYAYQPTPLGRYSAWVLGAHAAQGRLAVCAQAPQARPDALSTPPTDDVSWGQVSARCLPSARGLPDESF
jgi:hypothetical protein